MRDAWSKRPRKPPFHWGIHRPYKLILIHSRTWEGYKRYAEYHKRDYVITIRLDICRPTPLMCRWPIDEIIIADDFPDDITIHQEKKYLDLYKNPLTHKAPYPCFMIDTSYYD